MLQPGTGRKRRTAQNLVRVEPGLRIVGIEVGCKAWVRPKRRSHPFPDVTPAKTPARRSVRRHFPLDLGWQAAPGPAAPGIGLPPDHVHHRLVAEHPHGVAEPGLHNGAAGNADLLDIARPPPALALQPLPACRIPKFRMVVAAVVDKLDYCAQVTGWASISNSGTLTGCCALSLSKTKPAPGPVALPICHNVAGISSGS